MYKLLPWCFSIDVYWTSEQLEFDGCSNPFFYLMFSSQIIPRDKMVYNVFTEIYREW